MKLFSEKHTTPDGIELSFKREQRGMWNPRVLVFYPGEVGQHRSLAESRPIPGNSRWCSVWLNSRESSGVDPKRGAVCSWEDSRRYDVLSYTSGQQAGVV